MIKKMMYKKKKLPPPAMMHLQSLRVMPSFRPAFTHGEANRPAQTAPRPGIMHALPAERKPPRRRVSGVERLPDAAYNPPPLPPNPRAREA
jgi:hypothetical protein